MAKAAMYCQRCGTVGVPKKVTKGSFAIEVLLWLAMIFPGVIYSIWRLTTRFQACPSCGSPEMIPVDSPKAKAALGTGGTAARV